MKTYQRTFAAAAVMIAAFVLVTFAGQSEQIKPNRSFDDFPMQIDEWQGKKGQFDQEVYDILGVDDSILATYYARGNPSVNLYVGFYQSQKEGDLIHSPKNCMPGAGWNITRTATETVEVTDAAGQSRTIKTIKLMLQNGSEKQVMLYWFQSRGRNIASEYMQKIWLVIDSITRHRTDGSFVRYIAPVAESEKATVSLLKGFIQKTYPLLDEFIPS